ncbi:MAG: glutamate ligase domain-containing protein, partial [Flavobacteriaceae bacterium]
IKKGSNTIILDAYNANPSSMKAALTNFNDLKTDNKIVFLGDMFELGKAAKTEHETIADFADSLKVENIVLIGENFHNTTYASHRVLKFKSFENFTEGFDFSKLKEATILIKGSRGMAMERLLEFI